MHQPGSFGFAFPWPLQSGPVELPCVLHGGQPLQLVSGEGGGGGAGLRGDGVGGGVGLGVGAGPGALMRELTASKMFMQALA